MSGAELRGVSLPDATLEVEIRGSQQRRTAHPAGGRIETSTLRTGITSRMSPPRVPPAVVLDLENRLAE
jgi:hypothetical protein